MDTVGKGRPKSYDNQRSIFVGNLPFVTTDDELYDFFQECGDIEAVRVVRDTQTGVGKGFAFVLFKSKDSVVLALEKNESKFKKRVIRIKRIESDKNKLKKKMRDNRDPRDEEKKSHHSGPKKEKKFEAKSGFGGLAAKKLKKKVKKKKEIKATQAKKKQKTMAQILAK